MTDLTDRLRPTGADVYRIELALDHTAKAYINVEDSDIAADLLAARKLITRALFAAWELRGEQL